MPKEPASQDLSELVDVQPGTTEAEALCFLYANSDYGFRPEDVSEHMTISMSSTDDALASLFDKDVVGKTVDGYYHALDDPYVSLYADDLRQGALFDIGTGEVPYPNKSDCSPE